MRLRISDVRDRYWQCTDDLASYTSASSLSLLSCVLYINLRPTGDWHTARPNA